MKRSIILSAVLAIVFVFSSSALAATVDIVSYMGAKVGKWGILQETGSSTKDGFITVQGANRQILRKWYNNDGSGWTFDSSEVWKVTPTSLQFIGSNDGKDLWVFEPKLIFPRPMKLNKAVVYNGIIRNKRTNATLPFIGVFVVTKKGLTVDTTAGSFSDCIKIQTYEYVGGIAREAAQLCGPQRGELRTWVSKIKDTTDPVIETQNAFSKEMIQFGDSDPPIP